MKNTKTTRKLYQIANNRDETFFQTQNSLIGLEK